jgi:hypothetical protein
MAKQWSQMSVKELCASCFEALLLDHATPVAVVLDSFFFSPFSLFYFSEFVS